MTLKIFGSKAEIIFSRFWPKLESKFDLETNRIGPGREREIRWEIEGKEIVGEGI